MKVNRDRWIALTAGVGGSEFEDAALRVRDALSSFGIVEKVIMVTTNDLPLVCPITSELYPELLNSQTRGYGYMSWKAEIVAAATRGKWGNFDGIIWIDAGCEVTINHLSKIRLLSFKRRAIKYGVACFTLDTPEIAYTKRDLFEIFPQVPPKTAGNQIQATWFFLHGSTGKRVANEWFDTVQLGANFLDLNPSSLPEFPEFIENRYDQSMFSLVCKKNKIPAMKYGPTAGQGSFISSLRGIVNPIWTSRNRQGQTTKKVHHLILEKLYIFAKPGLREIDRIK